ncbi:AraC family transcriptional regulator [Aquabacterium sp.]|uniref:AraC family transcriptional regulator n=1 Tax=Aquabacterium sp. TaxID=1872578 RepID=UPI0024880224|nr:AraC family transcriptional regulator [Aquabacterium sp.]MDI1348889.1 AraC family transcriptional regulator [Aquabacterium sp.]
MRFFDFTRSPASARLMLAFAEERGAPVGALLSAAGLSRAQLDDPHTDITALQELRIAERLVQALGAAPGLGMEVGLRYSFSTYGIWGLGLVSSATAADAMSLALRSMPLAYAFSLIAVHEDGDTVVLSFGEPDVSAGLRRFLVARDMTAAARLLHEILGQTGVLTRFTLRSPDAAPPELLARLERQFGVRPRHGAAANTLGFDRRWLSMPLPQANPLTVAACEAAGAQLMARRRAGQGVTELVRGYLGVAPMDRVPDLPQVARLLQLSERTLKRRLQDDGTSFRALLADARQQQARTLLADGALSLTDIAEQMGFSDLSSFSQAFKRWFGVAPSRMR